MKIENVDVSTLLPDAANARDHSSTNLDAIKRSLRRFGQQKPIVVDARGVILAGNGTYRAAVELGWPKIDIVRTSLEGYEAVAFAIADNRTAELASWNMQVLSEHLQALKKSEIDLADVGFTEIEIKPILETNWSPPAPTHDEAGNPVAAKIPEPEEPPVVPTSMLGDLWILGGHRLLCGDSTKPGDIARLLDGEKAALWSTDPPYCVDYTGNDRPIHDGKPSRKDWSHVYREVDIKDLGEFLDAVFKATLPHVVDDAAIYVWYAHLQYPVIAATFEKYGLLLHQSLIWVKPVATFGHSYYRWRHEPCAFGWKRGHKPAHGFGSLDSVWEIDWEGKSRIVGNEHPTQKPLRIFEIPIEAHTKEGDLILETFSGSGSQLIAAEKTKRRCRAMEISPAFVDVNIRRWEKYTGNQATLHGTSKTFSQVAEERKSIPQA